MVFGGTRGRKTTRRLRESREYSLFSLFFSLFSLFFSFLFSLFFSSLLSSLWFHIFSVATSPLSLSVSRVTLCLSIFPLSSPPHSPSHPDTLLPTLLLTLLSTLLSRCISRVCITRSATMASLPPMAFSDRFAAEAARLCQRSSGTHTPRLLPSFFFSLLSSFAFSSSSPSHRDSFVSGIESLFSSQPNVAEAPAVCVHVCWSLCVSV